MHTTLTSGTNLKQDATPGCAGLSDDPVVHIQLQLSRRELPQQANCWVVSELTLCLSIRFVIVSRKRRHKMIVLVIPIRLHASCFHDPLPCAHKLLFRPSAAVSPAFWSHVCIVVVVQDPRPCLGRTPSPALG